MSLFRKIRRRHKAFVLKRSAQIHGDNAASVFSVDDWEDGDEDQDADFIVDSFQQADEQIGDVSACHESHQMPSRMEHFPLQADNSAQPSIIVPAVSGNEAAQGMQIVGKESRFRLRIAKTAVFLLITAGAFCIGKLATVGITLTLASAFKLFGRDRIKFCKSFTSAEAEQSRRSNKSLPLNTETVGPDSEEMAMIGSKATLVDESNGTVELIGSDLVTDAIGRRHESLQALNEEALDFKANGDSLLAQRKQLKRLNCIKITPSTSPFVETMEDSPSSSSKASPRSWFRNVRNSTPTGKGFEASFAETDNQGKLKSKVLLRHLRKKGEPLSAPPSPLSSSQEGSSNFCCIASDGSDTERSANRMTPVCRRSKFRPASPAKEVNASMGLPDKQIFQTLPARKGKRTPLPLTLLANEAMAADVPNAAMQKREMEASTFLPVGQERLTNEVHRPAPSQAVETMQSTLMPGTPTLKDVSVKVDTHSPLSSTHEPSRQSKELSISSRRPVTLVSQEGSITKAVTPMNQDSVLKRGKMQRKQVRVGSPWVAAGFMIMLAGLFVGRIMAVTGLVSYCYLLSLRKRKATERRR